MFVPFWRVFIRSTAVRRAPADSPQLCKEVWMPVWNKGGQRNREGEMKVRRRRNRKVRAVERDAVSVGKRTKKDRRETARPISSLHLHLRPRPRPPPFHAAWCPSFNRLCEVTVDVTWGLFKAVCKWYSSKKDGKIKKDQITVEDTNATLN